MLHRYDPHSPRLRSGSFQAEAQPVGLPGQRFRLSASARPKGVCLLSSLPDSIRLSDENRSTWVTLTRTGSWNHPAYGRFSITEDTLQQIVRNFQADTYGQKIFIDVGHNPDGGSGGEIVQLTIEGKRLRAQIDWTPWGVNQVTEKGFRYFSVDFTDEYVDPETDRNHGPLLFGAALTTRPFVKRLDPVTLSEDFTPPDRRVFMHPELRRQLSEYVETHQMNWLNELKKKLSALGFSDVVVKQLCATAQAAAKHLGEDETALQALSAQFVETGKTLSESIGDKDVKLSINLPEAPKADDKATQLSEERVAGMVSRQLKAAEDAAEAKRKQQADSLADRQKVLADTVDAADGLSDESKAELKKTLGELINENMTADQVKRLAEFQLTQANQAAAQAQLSALGYQSSRSGSPQITIDDAGGIKKLSGIIRENLEKTSVAQNGGLRLAEKDHPFLQRVLAEFDRHHASQLEHERKVLSGEVTVDGNTNLPAGFRREVIREALSDLNILALLQQLTDFTSTATTTMQIPYEERQTGGILNDGVVAEGAGIPNAGVSQKMDSAYVQAMKLAMNVTNEVMYFTRASMVNWDAWARTGASISRLIRDLLQRRVANELQRISDSYLSAPITGESIATQLDGSTSTIKTAQFPIVRPRQVKDISGNNVGSVQNAIVIDFDGTPVTEYDGSGTQSAGEYFRVTDFNLGYVQIVDESGDPVTPSETTATIGYSQATNLIKWDSDYVAAEISLEKHWNGALRAIGNRKAALNGGRQVQPDFSLMSPVLAEEVTNAEHFTPSRRQPGANANDVTGELERVKGLPIFECNAPQLDMGDSRILIGQRGVGAYGIAKPWMIAPPFEAVNAQGQPTGQKVAYGEEYNVVHVPSPVHYRFSSVLVYSATGR